MNAFLESHTGLFLLDPWLLATLAGLVVVWLVRRRRPPPSMIFGPFDRIDASAHGGWRVRLAGLPMVLRVLGLGALGIALARPVHRDRLPLETRGIDIALCLDLSSSMTATDMDAQRSRLSVAKDAAAEFIAGRPNDRIALVGFARFPDVRCPFTLDHVALGRILGQLDTVASDGPEDATGIGTAVALAARILRPSTARSKIVIVFTDGEENVATAQTPDEIAPLHAGQLCKDLGIRVYSIAAGIGARDAAGAIRKLDVSQIRSLSAITNGHFYEARDAGALAAVYAEIDQLEKDEVQEPRYRIRETFVPFVAIGILLLVLGRLLGSTILEVIP